MRYALATLATTGMGNAATPSLVAGGVSAGASIAAGALIGGPIGAAVGAAVAITSQIIASLFKPNLQKIQASNDANQIGDILSQNLDNWLSIPTNQRYKSIQTAALQVFDTGWQQYVSAVKQIPNWNTKAPDSISDRQQGSCAYHVTQPYGWINGQWVPAGANVQVGSKQQVSGYYCWNWFTGFRDPIANDPYVIPDPSATSNIGSAVSSLFSGNQSFGLLAIGGLILIGGYFVSQN